MRLVQGSVSDARVELAGRAQRLRAQGKLQREIAEILGVSRSYAASLSGNDPLGEKARERKDGYRGVCETCGAATSGSDGPQMAAAICGDCRVTKLHADRYWTRDRIIEAIRRWAKKHGRVPVALDWLRAGAEHEHPSFASVYGSDTLAPFNCWAEAIEAAGFPRPRQGQRPDDNWWDNEAILNAIRRWAREHGAPPTANGWAVANTGYPRAKSVQRYFGSWNAAIAAAGFTPRRPGQRARRTTELAALPGEAPHPSKESRSSVA